jgi:hypothetical protein
MKEGRRGDIFSFSGAGRGRPWGWHNPAAAACALCFIVGGGRRRLGGLGGPKGRMGRLAAGPIGPKVEGKFVSE